MATLSLISVWGHTPRPWGYEVRVDFADETGVITNEVLTFAQEPSAAELEGAVTAQRERVEARLAAEALAPAVIPPPVEVLVARVAELEAQVAAAGEERVALVEERDALRLERDALQVAEQPGRLGRVG